MFEFRVDSFRDVRMENVVLSSQHYRARQYRSTGTEVMANPASANNALSITHATLH